MELTKEHEEVSSEEAALEYANIHQLDELVDSIICNVAEKKPENTKKFMAHFLKTRLRNTKQCYKSEFSETEFMNMSYSPETCQSNMTMTTTPRTTMTTLSSSPEQGTDDGSRWSSVLSSESEKEEDDAHNELKLHVTNSLYQKERVKQRNVGHKGVWQYISRDALPLLTSQMKELAKYENVLERLPPEYINELNRIIIILAKASECIPLSAIHINDNFKTSIGKQKLNVCLKELHLSPHQETRKAFELLEEIILNNTPLATFTEQQQLTTLINYVCCQVQKGLCIEMEQLFCDIWKMIRRDAKYWGDVVKYSYGELFTFDPLMILDDEMLKMCVYIFDKLSIVLPNWEKAKQSIKNSIFCDKNDIVEFNVKNDSLSAELDNKEAWFHKIERVLSYEMADKFAFYAVLLSRCVEEILGQQFCTTAHTNSFNNVIQKTACLIFEIIHEHELTEHVTTKVYNYDCQKKVFTNLVATCRSFMGKRTALLIARSSKHKRIAYNALNFTIPITTTTTTTCNGNNKNNNNNNNSNSFNINSETVFYLQDSFTSYLEANLSPVEKIDEACEVFIRVVHYIVANPFLFSKNESILMNTKILLSTLLLQLCEIIIVMRNIITTSEVQRFSSRFLLYGVPISDMYMFFQRTFISVTLILERSTCEPKLEYRLALHILKLFEKVFARATATTTTTLSSSSISESSYLHKAQESLRLLQETENFKEITAQYLSHACCEVEITPHTLTRSVCLPELISAILKTLSSEESESLMCESIVKIHTILSARLMLCRYKPQRFWSIVTTALLASCNTAASQLVTFSLLLPAIQIIGMINSSIVILEVPLKISSQDKFMLLSFFQSCKLQRIIHWAIENFMLTFPEYRARLLQPSFAHERLENLLATFIFILLWSTREEKSKEMKFWSTRMNVYGVKKLDLLLFGISLTEQLRRANFPEYEWVIFYHNLIDELEKRKSVVRELSFYESENDMHKIKLIQKTARRYLLRCKLSAISHTSSICLQERLEQISNKIHTHVENLNSSEPEPKEITKITRNYERSENNTVNDVKQLVHLSWNALSQDVKNLILYKAIVRARASDLNTCPLNSEMFDVEEKKVKLEPPCLHFATMDNKERLHQSMQKNDNIIKTMEKRTTSNCTYVTTNVTTATTTTTTTTTTNANVTTNNKEESKNVSINNNVDKIMNKSSNGDNNKNIFTVKNANDVGNVINQCANNDAQLYKNENVSTESSLSNEKTSPNEKNIKSLLSTSPSTQQQPREAQRNLMVICETVANNMSSLINLLSQQESNKENVRQNLHLPTNVTISRQQCSDA